MIVAPKSDAAWFAVLHFSTIYSKINVRRSFELVYIELNCELVVVVVFVVVVADYSLKKTLLQSDALVCFFMDFNARSRNCFSKSSLTQCFRPLSDCESSSESES